MDRLFGTSGIRGPAQTLLINQFCFDIGRTFGRFLEKHQQLGSVAIGMDPRSSSNRIKGAVAAGLAFAGREVLDEGVTPVPAMNYILIVGPNLAGSIMISGSHIKRELNGIKFFAFKEEILKEHEKEIEEIYRQIKGQSEYQESLEKLKPDTLANTSYMSRLKQLAQVPYPAWRVIVDPGNGAQSLVMPKVLKDLGLTVHIINADIQQPILTRDPEAEAKGEFVSLQNQVKKEKANLGIVYDSDGDRVTFIDEGGDFIPGDYIGTLLSSDSGSLVVTPINTSQVVDQIGKKVYRTRVGSPYVVEKMKEVGATFGFEANGGTISSEIMMSRDGGSTTIKILNLMKQTGKSLKQLVEELPRFYLYRTKVDCPWELDQKVLKAAKEKFKGIKIEELDGLKIWLDETTWILFRSSANVPEFRVFAEAETQKQAIKLGQDGIQLVQETIQ